MIDFHRHITTPFPYISPDTYWFATTRIEEYKMYQGDTSHMHGYGYLFEQESDEIESAIEKYLQNDPFGYIGEVGIDTRLTHLISLEKQLEVVKKLTQLALEYSRPIVFHVNASFTLMEKIFTLGKGHIIMIVHNFTGSVETAHELYKKGVYVSIGPRVWQQGMKIGKRIKEVNVPLLLETDYTDGSQDQYESLLKQHYAWYAREKEIEYKTVVEQMNELSSVFQNHPINR